VLQGKQKMQKKELNKGDDAFYVFDYIVNRRLNEEIDSEDQYDSEDYLG
jgi:hypothetical protein